MAITCPTCNGKGTVTVWTTDRKGKRFSYEKTCGECGGKGTVGKEK